MGRHYKAILANQEKQERVERLFFRGIRNLGIKRLAQLNEKMRDTGYDGRNFRD